MTTSVSSAGPSDNTTVFVSGSSFCMVPSLYQKVEKLRWQKRRGFPHLSAHADVFEILLQFLMFGKLPETTGMTTRQAAELLKMIDPLDHVELLAEHVKLFLVGGDKQGKKKSSSFLRRRMSSMTPLSKEDESIDLFDITQNSTQPTITLNDHHRSPNKPPLVDDLIDLFAFADTRTVPSRKTLDALPYLQMADSADSSEASSMVVEQSSSYDPPAPSTTLDKLVSPYHDHDDDCATTTTLDPTHASSSSSSSSMSSFRVVVPSKESLRNMFQKFKGKDVSRTHAEWCASDYVL
jgi:hypothetical protein